MPWLPENPSVLAVLVALVAIGNFAYLIYRDLIQRPRFKLFMGDTVGVVCSSGSGARKLHLTFSVVNVGRRGGALTFVRACLRDDKRKCLNRHFHWKLFWKGVPGAELVEKEEDCHPVPVPSGQAIILRVELESPDDQRTLLLADETLTVVVEAWVDREAISESFDESIEGVFTTTKRELEFALRSSSAKVCRYRRAEWRESGAEKSLS